ncbi:MAG: TetR/AcrR family transcriptional regulator [Solirubrobacterales bacterium]
MFDEGSDPSIRQLAKELNVTPSAIYHHFESRAKIVQAAVELVWKEILEALFERVGDPFAADPVDVLIAAGEATRGAFGRHYAIAPYMAATPASDELSAGTLAIVANVFERFGLKGQDAAEAFHAYSSFTFGTALFSANRIAANSALDISLVEVDRLERFRSEANPEVAQLSSAETRSAIDGVMDISIVDPERDEELFSAGLRKLIESMRP